MADASLKFPDAIIDHVYSEDLDRWYEEFFVSREVFEAERAAVEEAVWKVYTRAVTIDGFLRELSDVFGSEERATPIAVEILGNDFLKIQDYLGVDIAAYIRTLGGDPAKYVKEIVVSDLVQRVLEGAGLAGIDPAIRRRVEAAAAAFMTGVRLRPATVEMLTRSEKIGGAGLDFTLAETFVAALDETVQDLRKSGVAILGEARPAAPPEHSAFHLVRPTKGSMVQPEDEVEIAQLRRSAPDVADRGSYLDATIDRVIVATGAKFKDADVERRFRRAVESRLRDIRDHQETLDLFTRDKNAGGLGIPQPVAEKVLGVIEGEFGKFHPRTDDHGSAQTAEDIADGKESITPSEVIPPMPAPTTAITPQLVHPVPPPAPRAPPLTPPTPPPQEPPRPTRVDPTPPLPSAPTPSLASSRAEPVQIAERFDRASREILPVQRDSSTRPPTVDSVGMTRGEGAAAPAAPARLSMAVRSEPRLSMPLAKPKLHDIRPVPPRLVGPVEELGQLTVADFRRIARNPTDAVARILEKVTFLEKEAYTKRAEGIRALRGSPLLTTYADILNAALLGKRTVDVELADRAAQDRNALTKAEFDVLKTLNAQLRF